MLPTLEDRELGGPALPVSSVCFILRQACSKE